MNIRLAKSDDLKIIQDLNHELFILDNEHFEDLNVGWSYSEEAEGYFRNLIEGVSGACWVAEAGNEIVGYLAGSFREQGGVYKGMRAELDNMFIKESFRRQMVGSSLVDSFMRWCVSHNVEYVFVTAYSPNTRALAFYAKNKFESYSETLCKKL